ncbi:hypothetical protein Avbf_10028 [Armadillidium vulgare]|nr:hypothetical protein Avbf_10028 [Armadillidium vulgare]
MDGDGTGRDGTRGKWTGWNGTAREETGMKGAGLNGTQRNVVSIIQSSEHDVTISTPSIFLKYFYHRFPNKHADPPSTHLTFGKQQSKSISQAISHTQEKHLQQLYHNGITAISIFEASSRKIKSLHATLEIFKSLKGILRVCTHHLASSGFLRSSHHPLAKSIKKKLVVEEPKASNHKASRKQNESQRSTGEGIKAFRKTKKSKHQEKQNESQRSTGEGIKAFRKTKKSKHQESRTNHSVLQAKESKPSGKQRNQGIKKAERITAFHR